MSLAFCWYQQASRVGPSLGDGRSTDGKRGNRSSIVPSEQFHWLKPITFQPSPVQMGWEVNNMSSGENCKGKWQRISIPGGVIDGE